ncbi:hypothetical protein, partial [Phocaeicola vulgatus]|uniref:hypothetical protein n=1 Tax=Phocaeicola vulgatus TaxID=821 RepID=UPI0032C12AB0
KNIRMKNGRQDRIAETLTILQGEGIWMIFKFAFIEFKSENYLSHCHSTNYFAEKQVVKM